MEESGGALLKARAKEKVGTDSARKENRSVKNKVMLKSWGNWTLNPTSWLSFILASTELDLQQSCLTANAFSPLQAEHLADSFNLTEDNFPLQKCILTANPITVIR